MELSNGVEGGLQLCGDPFRIPDKCFEKLVTLAVDELLKNGTSEQIFDVDECNSVDRGVLKQAYYALLTLFVESVKVGIETVMLQSTLDDCKVPSERSAIICDAYKKHHSAIVKHLERYSFSLPRIVDVDWRLDYSIMSNVVEKCCEPVYMIQLKKKLACSDQLEEELFTCTVDELQDLVGKLKDAVKCWSKKTENFTV